MEWKTSVLLIGAGIVGGLVNALAGGATLITFPAMLAAGLPPVVANASNAVAISPGHLVAAMADRERLPKIQLRVIGLCIGSLLGGTIGAILLLVLPERYFIQPIPVLIGGATLLFAFAPQLQSRAQHRRSLSHGRRSEARGIAVTTLASIYGGFFGGGLGIMLTAILSLTEQGDLRAIKALKNVLAAVISLAAVVIFCAQGVVRWPETGMMLVGAILGGYMGGYLIRVLPADGVRRIVIVAGTLMTAVYAYRYWW